MSGGRRVAVACGILGLLLGCRPPGVTSSAAITAEEVAQTVERLAHDSARGRTTGSPELRTAGEWVALAMGHAGLQPGFGDGYIDHFRVELRAMDTAAVAISAGRGEQSIAWADGLAVAPATAGRAVGPLLVVREGQEEEGTKPAWGGRVVLRMLREPDVGSRRAIERRAYAAARARGAAALVVGYLFPGSVDSVRGMAAELALSGPAYTAPGAIEPVRLWLASAPAQRLEALGSGTPVSIDAPYHVLDPGLTPNVLGMIPGVDPDAAAVLVMAHLDAQGTTTRAGWRTGLITVADPSGDSIFNGADDNASGVAVLLEVAQALARESLRPHRSVLFLATGGEESGLLGARHFIATAAADAHIAAVINLDMVGRNHPGRIHVIGAPASALRAMAMDVIRASSELEVESLAPAEERGLFDRSDHAPFAEHGIPAIWLFGGLHPDYHTVEDEAEFVDAEKAARVARAVAELVRRLAGPADPHEEGQGDRTSGGGST